MSKENKVSEEDIIKQLNEEFDKSDNKENYLLNLIEEVDGDGE